MWDWILKVFFEYFGYGICIVGKVFFVLGNFFFYRIYRVEFFFKVGFYRFNWWKEVLVNILMEMGFIG